MPGLTIQPRNRLLRSLSPDVLEYLRPKLQITTLKHRRILHHAYLPIEQIYFVETGLVSVVAATEQEGDSVEGWIIGSEGLVGTPVVLGVASSPHRRTVQVGGTAWMMRSADVAQALGEIPEFRQVLLRYIHSVLVQTAQLGACNARHAISQKLARWLLMAHDRLETREMGLTHDGISKMLGVRRASISTALQEMEQDGVIATSRKEIIILDRAKLESIACHCYGVLKAEFQRDLTTETAAA